MEYNALTFRRADLIEQLPNFLADTVGPFNTIIPASFITGVTGLAWISVQSEGSLIAFCFFYGFFSGSFVALTAVVWAALSPDLKVIGTRIGMMTVPTAAGLLIGNPIAGVIESSDFVGLQIFCGCTVLGGSILLLLARLKVGSSEGSWKF